MSPPISILRATHPPARAALPVKTVKIFTHQDESKPVACPYCKKSFYSRGGQARHIVQTDCRLREQATFAAVRLKRSLEESRSQGRAAKQVRFTHEHVTFVADFVENTSETARTPPVEEPTAEPPSFPTSEPSARENNPQSSSHSRLVSHDEGLTYIEHFPDPRAGSPINDSIAQSFDLRAYIQSTGVLSNPHNFDTLELLMTTGLTNGGRDRFLKSREYAGRTPWKDCDKMLEDLDKLPCGPTWRMYEIEIQESGGHVRTAYLFGRNILDIVRALIGDSAFKDELHYTPMRHWTGKDRKVQLYSEAWTGRWWWRMQMVLPDKLATIVPLIIATDETVLSTMCGGQRAYPVYATIGNIPKSIRRKAKRHATLLLGYLPVEDFSHVANLEERSRRKHQLIHDAMAVLMEPLKRAAKEGVVMTCADGRQRRVYPIPAAFEGDWPEQCGMACAEESGCPICEQARERRSDYPNLAPLRNPTDTLEALRRYWEAKDLSHLRPLRLKPWWPWWASIPHVNFHTSVMPDLLHQLYQGMIKTCAISWTKQVVGVGLVDKCFRAMPGTVGLRYFANGISKVKKWTGRESREMAKQLLPIVAGQEDANPNFVGLVRSILDFTFRAHQTRMSEEDIEQLERALSEIHTKKNVLVTLGVYEKLEYLNRIKKLHMLTHYSYAIREMGTPDGYSTEAPEYLHIIYAKRGWRKSNKVRPLPFMIKFVQRYEAIRIHRAYMDQYYGFQDHKRADSRVVYGEDEDAIGVDGEGSGQGEGFGQGTGANKDAAQDGGDKYEEESDDEGDCVRGQVTASAGQQHVCMDPNWSMAIRSPAHVNGNDIIQAYGAPNLDGETNEWMQQSTLAGLLPEMQPVSRHHSFDVWHKFYLHHRPLYFDPDLPPHRDTIRAKPPAAVRTGSLRSPGPGTFDTVLFLARPDESGIYRYRAGRVRVIFTLPRHLRAYYPHPLVYLELFAPFSKRLAESHRMYTTERDEYRGTRRSLVIPLSWVVSACHLVPFFGEFETSSPFDRHDLLSTGKRFFLNHYSNHFIFGLVVYWRAIKAKADAAKAAEAEASRAEAARAKAARAKASRTRLVQARDRIERAAAARK